MKRRAKLLRDPILPAAQNNQDSAELVLRLRESLA